MESISRVIVSLVYYNSLVRDTLEYTMERDSYNIEFYNYKKQGIINEIKVQSPLKLFLDQNGEKGESFRKQLEDFGETLYNENSTIIKMIDNKIEVDHNQNVLIFEKTIPLHESLNNIILIHKEYASNEKKLEPKIEKLLNADERFYRAVALMTLSQEIRKQFVEYNKIMNESRGEKTPQANFVEQDLNKLASLMGLVRQNAKCTDEIYTKALDLIFNYLEMMNGKRDLPAGKSFDDVFNEITISLAAFIEDAEKDWKEIYQPCLDELVKENAQLREAAKKEGN